jgi:predicted amidohydrolase
MCGAMKLSVVQFCPEYGQKAKNLAKVLDYAEKIDSDIIVFPELCTTGYFFQSKEEVLKYAEPADGETVSKLQDISSKKGKIIVVGFAELDGGDTYNSAAVIMPDRNITKIYRKIHLFYKERFCFSEGNSGYFVVEDKKRNVKIGTMICYDWRFPEAARSLGLLGADVIVCPSNLVTKIWPNVMPARAIENKVYVAIANRYGTETAGGESVEFNGISGIWKYNGEVMVQAGAEEETVLTVEIEPEKTRNKSFNEFNDIFGDRRPEYYIIK